MYVKTFKGETLDETLKSVKVELGPDAIILKTKTNKGLKGAFKKTRYEITAAISERNYVKKAKVDHVFDEVGDREKFYQQDSSYVSQMINSYNGEKKEVKSPPMAPSSYQGLGLNKAVKQSKSPDLNSFLTQTKQAEEKPQTSGLDSFLSAAPMRTTEAHEPKFEEAKREPARTPLVQLETQTTEAFGSIGTPASVYEENRIAELEKQVKELTETLKSQADDAPRGLEQLKKTLKTLDISDQIIQKMTKKIVFELSPEELEDEDCVFDFGLRELNKCINISMPMFSKANINEEANFTILLSDGASGQSSLTMKLAALKENALIIRYGDNEETQTKFAESMFGLNIVKAKKISEIFSECRKAKDAGQTVFIDMNTNADIQDEIKQFVDGMNRAFDNVEVLACLSAIHSELYNTRMLNRLKTIATGMIYSHLDLCLNYGALINTSARFANIPLMFFGTGRNIPNDLEAATSERILAEMFEF